MKKTIFTILLLCTASSYAIPNPAATNCTNQGYRYLLVKNVGICLFPDNSYCEEWAFFKGTCKPGQNKAAVDTNGNTTQKSKS